MSLHLQSLKLLLRLPGNGSSLSTPGIKEEISCLILVMILDIRYDLWSKLFSLMSSNFPIDKLIKFLRVHIIDSIISLFPMSCNLIPIIIKKIKSVNTTMISLNPLHQLKNRSFFRILRIEFKDSFIRCWDLSWGFFFFSFDTELLDVFQRKFE